MEREGGRILCSLLEKATTSTAQEVDPRLLKAIKSTVRSSDAEVRLAVETLMEKMKKDHSQVRYLTLLIIDELFMRSKLFRSLIVIRFDQFLSLSVGFRRNLPLPPPVSIASLLRSKSIEFLEKWNNSFGIHYKQLRLGFDYLKNTLKFQFPNRLENAARVQRERREREARSKEILLNKFETLRESFHSIKSEIESTLNEIAECIEIVQINEDKINFTSFSEADSIEEYRCPSLQQIRLDALKEGERVHENSENKAIFDVLRELYKLLVTRHLPSVQEWISTLVRVEPGDSKFRDSALKEFIDIRNNLQSVKKRCEQLGCSLNAISTREEEDLWEEGNIEVYENENSSESRKPIEEFILASEGRTSSKGNEVKGKALDHEGECSDSSPLKRKLLAEAPVMTWGSYLDNWGFNRDVLANQRGLELESHWGRVDYDAVIPAEKIAELNVQATVYKEKLDEIRPCHAPLIKGGLCQRKDLRVCPFHGPIIPRDSEGNPVGQNPSTNEKSEEELTTQEMEFVGGGEGHLDLDEVAKKIADQAVKNVRNRESEEKREINKRNFKRARLAKVRGHNEAVLRESAVASTSRSEFIAEDRGSTDSIKGNKQTLASMLRKKVTAKDRLGQRLLNSRVTDAAIRQLRQGEEANYRENYPNQW